MKKIPLAQRSRKFSGKYFALVDDEDYDFLMQYKWAISFSKNTMYAKRTINTKTPNGIKCNSVLMHREVMKMIGPKPYLDHKDKNGLNNQKSNLRKCTSSQNAANTNPQKNSSSNYLGVSLKLAKHPSGHQRYYYTGTITFNNIKFHLGCFPFTRKGEIEAAKRYDLAARWFYEEFAYQNFK